MLSVLNFMSVPFPFGVGVVMNTNSNGSGTGTYTTLAGRGLPDVCYLLPRSAPALCWPGIFLGCVHGRWL